MGFAITLSLPKLVLLSPPAEENVRLCSKALKICVSLCVLLQVQEQDGWHLPRQFCCLIRLTVYSELGCGLEEDAMIAKYMHAAGPAVHGTAQIRVWIYKGIVVPLKYHPTANQVQN